MSHMTLQEAIELLDLEAVRAADGSVSISEESLRRVATEQAKQRQIERVEAAVAPKTVEQARGAARRFLQEQQGPQRMNEPGRSVPANQPSAVEGVNRS